MQKIFFSIFFFLTFVFLLHYWLVGQAVYGDGIYYWSYVRSAVIDRDLQVFDEQQHHYSHSGNNTPEKKIILRAPTKIENLLTFHLPIGSAIGWLPFFLFAQFAGIALRAMGIPILLNGYSDWYQIIVGIGNVLYGVLGLLFVYRMLHVFFSKKISLFSTILLLLASNLFYYTSIDVLNTHSFSFFLSSAFFYLWITKRQQHSWHHWILMGGLIGLLIETRAQEITFLVIIFGDILLARIFEKKKFSESLIFHYLLLFFVMGIAYLPQMFLWQWAYHSLSPYSGSSFDFFHPHVLGLLINSKTGLLFTSPILLIGCAGLFTFYKKQKKIALTTMLFVFAEYYVIASWGAWDQAASYGIRMLITSMPVFAIGLAAAIEKALQKYSQKIIAIVAACFILLNFLMILRFHLLIKDPTYDRGKVTRGDTMGKINKVLHTNFH